MAITDRSLGIVGLVLSCVTLGYMFFHLMIVPILPLAQDNILKLPPPTVVLGICGFFGFAVIGTLLVYTFYILYKKQP